MTPPVSLAALRHDLRNVTHSILCVTRELAETPARAPEPTRLMERLDRLTHLLADIAYELRRYA